MTIYGWVDTSNGRILKWSRKSLPQIHEISTKQICFENIKDSLKFLLSKGKKEKEIINALEMETESKIKVSDLRKWKNQISSTVQYKS